MIHCWIVLEIQFACSKGLFRKIDILNAIWFGFQSGYKLSFDDRSWKKYMSSLKPLVSPNALQSLFLMCFKTIHLLQCFIFSLAA